MMGQQFLCLTKRQRQTCTTNIAGSDHQRDIRGRELLHRVDVVRNVKLFRPVRW